MIVKWLKNYQFLYGVMNERFNIEWKAKISIE